MSEPEILARLEGLERDNRRMKGIIIGLLILAAALGGIHATQPTPQKVTAREFDAIDSSGKVRARIGVSQEGQPSIELSNAQGKAVVDIALILDTPFFALSNPQNGASILMNLLLGRAGIVVRGRQGQTGVDILAAPTGEPTLELSDSQGFTMDLGATQTVTLSTGETQQTSAASIVMFANDKDHRVIWKAP